VSPIVTIVAPVFLVMGLGALCARLALFPVEAQKVFGVYVFFCAMPCYLFLAMAHMPRDQVFHGDFLAAFAVGMAGTAVIGAAVTRWLGHRGFGECVLGMMSACQTNSVYIGVPIIAMAYGAPGPVIIISLFQVIVMTILVLGCLELHQTGRGWSWRTCLSLPRIALGNPIVGASLLGMVFSWQDWTVPVLAERTGQLLGNAGIPTALFALGLSLGQRRPRLEAGCRTLIGVLVGVKGLVHPALTWLVGRHLFGMGEASLGTLTLIAAMPTALNTYIFAERYGIFVSESSQIILLSSLVSVVMISTLLEMFGVAG
jgi:hypothetical protein